MILLSFFFPLAIYLLILGFINRRRHPQLISGIWDGIGLLFGVSGFLLFAGPAVLSALSERWRLFWLLGRNDLALPGTDGTRPFWIFLSALYFVLIVGGTVLYFWRQRRVTAIYNADAELVERSLTDACKQLGLAHTRSGSLFLFGTSPDLSSKRSGETAIYRPSSDDETRIADDELGAEAIVEVESFPLMRHVTLHWHPANWQWRRSVETELSRRLSETAVGENLLSGWLLTAGFILLSFVLAGAFFLFLLLVFRR